MDIWIDHELIWWNTATALYSTHDRFVVKNYKIFDRYVANFVMKFEVDGLTITSQLSLLGQRLISVRIWGVPMRENGNCLDYSVVQIEDVSITLKALYLN